MSIVITNEITVPSSRMEEVAAKFAANGEKIRQLPGFEGFEVCAPTEPADGRVLVITRWRDEEAYRSWRDSAQFAASHRHEPADRGSAPASAAGLPGSDSPAATPGSSAPAAAGRGPKNSVVRHYRVAVAVSP